MYGEVLRCNEAIYLGRIRIRKWLKNVFFFRQKNGKELFFFQSIDIISLQQFFFVQAIYIYLIIHNKMSDQRKSGGQIYPNYSNQFKNKSNSQTTQESFSKFNPHKFQANTNDAKKSVQNSYNHQQHNFSTQNGQFNNYYMPNIYQSSNQFNSNGEIHSLINNMCVALSNQSRILNYLVDKNEQNMNTTTKIYEQMTNSKKQQVVEVQKKSKSHFKQANSNSDITANDLVSILYGIKPNFKFKLVMDKEILLEKTLYRERNFKLKINLFNENNKLFFNSNKIPISLALYTVQNPPKFLESNTLGNKMLKGYTEQDMINGTCMFEKIQIKQVTSHYRKGMLFLVAFAKKPSFGFVNDQYTVDYTQIHPLVIDKVIVKAKKSKQEIMGKESVQKQKQKDSQKGVTNDQGMD